MVSGLTLTSGGAGVLNLFRQIGLTNRNIAGNQLRLSSGLRINAAKDDPAGLVQSQALRAQFTGADERIKNLTNQANLFNTAESTLGEVSDLLVSIRESIVAAQGSLTSEELAAEQENVNTALSAIDSLIQNSAFGKQQLLNGSSSVQVTSKDGELLDLQIRSLGFGGATSRGIKIQVAAEATRATATVVDPATDPVAAGGDVDLRISGPLGTRDFTLSSGATGNSLLAAINSDVLSTGVYAQINGSALELRSVDPGSDQSFTLSQVGGAGTFTPGTISATGTDAEATADGIPVFARGNRITAVGSNFNFTFELQEGVGAADLSFSARKSGVPVTLSPDGSNLFHAGLPFSNTSNLGSPERSYGLGTIGGFLDSLRSGGANDLATNANNALVIADEAISDVSGSRAYLGGVVSNLLESGIDALDAQSTNLKLSFDALVGLDYAAETTNYTANQILQQAQIATLASSNLQSQKVFDLLLYQNLLA